MFLVTRLIEHNSQIENLSEPNKRHFGNRSKMGDSAAGAGTWDAQYVVISSNLPGKTPLPGVKEALV
jgi:hypothetical protein